jgi:hypothetical protein
VGSGMTSTTVRSSAENDEVLEDPTAFLDDISDDGPPVADEDYDSFEPWEAERVEVVAELADELGPFEWHRMMELADRGQIDPRDVLRDLRARRCPRRSISVVRVQRRRERRSRPRRARRTTRTRAPARPRQDGNDPPDRPEAR